ncbi:DUF7322 domain-containing protein [Haloplanus salinus]|uniref:DUF7322 domain-containing protein n=1 Tax=Haloplanus salinus TaxID=1126245 RepID=UPI0015F04F01|nr:hypothetical protein [Haloplanus salinus]
MFDPWPDEPEETNPESRWGDPERDLPRIPEPAVAEKDVDPEILETFWRSVVLANVALFGLSLGPMLVYFRGWWLWGGGAVALGALAGHRVYQHYRAFERRHGDDDEPGPADGGRDATPADDPERNA